MGVGSRWKALAVRSVLARTALPDNIALPEPVLELVPLPTVRDSLCIEHKASGYDVRRPDLPIATQARKHDNRLRGLVRVPDVRTLDDRAHEAQFVEDGVQLRVLHDLTCG